MRGERGFWEAVLVLGLGVLSFYLLWRIREPVPQSGLTERPGEGVSRQ
ncbi:hypothetical protein [Candidatus Desulforudis audaxviator]|nr:hypothetical protein [Candidatus Desulforudis audaxviator]AZK60058.1 hypothetical protein Daudx_1511 [Candidatus Desulforudis audaxviator]